MLKLAVIASAIFVSGCASITGGTNQIISVTATQGANQVTGAQCTLVNDKGTFFVVTPGTLGVHRAYGDLNITCRKDGMDPGTTVVKSSTKGMAWGNILAGGIIGGAIDAGTGAAYDYPSLINVSMGIKTTIEPLATASGVAATPNQAK